METALKLLKEYGINAVLAFGLLYMNHRVSNLEEKLFDCYEARINQSLWANNDSQAIDNNRSYAVLVQEPKVRKTREDA